MRHDETADRARTVARRWITAAKSALPARTTSRTGVNADQAHTLDRRWFRASMLIGPLSAVAPLATHNLGPSGAFLNTLPLIASAVCLAWSFYWRGVEDALRSSVQACEDAYRAGAAAALTELRAHAARHANT